MASIQKAKLEQALDQYRDGKITLWKAAETAGISLWKILDIVRARRIPMPYALEDAEKDIKSAHK